MKLITKKSILIIDVFMSIFALLFLVINLMCPCKYKLYIKKYSLNNSIEPSLVCAIIYCESRFDKNAKSSKNACGLMQILPNTAKKFYFDDKVEFYDEMLFDAEINIRIGVDYLKYL